jgi:transcription factor SOX7/8/10/18 (SOX group E/F)
LEEKRVWEIKAKQAKAEHKARYPNYRFRPVHNKNKEKKKEKMQPTPEDERRCEEVAQLLLEGKKGEQLAEAVRNLDRLRSQTPTAVMAPPPLYPHRRSSSVPLPNDYCTPFGNMPMNPQHFLESSRDSFSRHQRMMLGQQRRPSSAGPAFFRPWTPSANLHPHLFQHDDLQLPDPDPTLFNTFSNFNFQAPCEQQNAPFNVNELLTSLPPHAQAHDTHNSLGPLEPLAPQDILSRMYSNDPNSPFDLDQAVDTNNNHAIKLPDLDISSWLSADSSMNSQSPGLPSSHSSSSYSGSPQPSDNCLPLPVYAPQPLHHDQTAVSMFIKNENIVTSDMWTDAVGYGNDNLGGTLGLNFAGNAFDFGPADSHVVDFSKQVA